MTLVSSPETESSTPREFSVIASAIQPVDMSGAVAVVVPPSSEYTVVLITRSGMLQLSSPTAVDASTAASLKSSMMASTGGPRDMIGPERRINMDAITVDQAEANRLGELEDIEKLLLVIHEIAETSEDAESVRLAFTALVSTELGKQFLEDHPITL